MELSKVKNSIIITLVLLSSVGLSLDSEMIGKAAPDFNLKEISSNNTITLQQIKNKVMVIDFWATWCAPCKKTLPILQSIKLNYKNKIEVLTINIDEEKKNAESFIKRFNLTMPVLYDANQKVIEKYKVPEMPTVFVIDKKGIIRFVHVGFSEDYEKELINNINKLF